MMKILRTLNNSVFYEDEGEINDIIAYDLKIIIGTRENSVMVLGLNVVEIAHTPK